HVHFMPDSVMRAVWRYFDDARDRFGYDWPVTYRVSEDERVALLDAFGVRAFPSLLYPHKPEMAEWLNEWAREFAARTPACVPTGTFFPEASAARYVREAIESG